MTHTISSGIPAPVVPLPADHWLTRLTDFHDRVINAVTALNAVDAGVPMLSSIEGDVESRRKGYLTTYNEEHMACSHLAGMIVGAAERAADHELAVRLALSEGQRPPVLADVTLVEMVIEESKAARNTSYPDVEAAGKMYQQACTIAAASRALLVRLQREPERVAAEKVLQEIRDIDARVGVAAGALDSPALEIQFKKEGLL